jgi:hypothetical protein
MAKKGANRNMLVWGGIIFLVVLVGVVLYFNVCLVKEGLANESGSGSGSSGSGSVPLSVPVANAPVPTVPAAAGPVQQPTDCPTGQQKIDGQCVNTSSMLKASAKVLLQYLGEQGDGK